MVGAGVGLGVSVLFDSGGCSETVSASEVASDADVSVFLLSGSAVVGTPSEVASYDGRRGFEG